MNKGVQKIQGGLPWYDTLWASVMKAVPKLDESESGQMVLK
jgi:hypothetical protein